MSPAHAAVSAVRRLAWSIRSGTRNKAFVRTPLRNSRTVSRLHGLGSCRWPTKTKSCLPQNGSPSCVSGNSVLQQKRTFLALAAAARSRTTTVVRMAARSGAAERVWQQSNNTKCDCPSSSAHTARVPCKTRPKTGPSVHKHTSIPKSGLPAHVDVRPRRSRLPIIPQRRRRAADVVGQVHAQVALRDQPCNEKVVRRVVRGEGELPS